MFCQNCGKKAEDIGKFCEFCGKETGFLDNNEAAAAVEQSQIAHSGTTHSEKVSQVNSIKMSRKQKIILTVGAILIIIGIIFYQYGVTITKPEAVANSYFSAIAKADYGTAYEFISLPEGDFLTKENYVKYMKKTIGTAAWVETFKINKNTDTRYKKPIKDLLKKSISFSYIAKGNNDEGFMNIELIKSGTKKYLLFDNWKVALDDYILEKEWLIPVPRGADLFINGKQVSKDNIKEEKPVNWFADENSAKIQVYAIKNVFPIEYDIKVKVANADDYICKLNTTQDVNISMAPNKDFKKTIEDIIKKYNENWFTAIKTININPIKEAVLENSNTWQNKTSFIQSLKNGAYKKYAVTFNSINFGNMYLEDASHIRVETAENWTENIEYNYGFANTNVNSQQKVYYLKKVNEKWLIYDIK